LLGAVPDHLDNANEEIIDSSRIYTIIISHLVKGVAEIELVMSRLAAGSPRDWALAAMNASPGTFPVGSFE
jgi:hypothetical protein